ncbi:MAG TPA: prepilin-type N-terminal cleavage/methylation domain-containing protein [Candidatus Udaeobacter sp.]|nr:prepilin-type N-terminal cleavage/methylation domain-containing protein [Candidatus Udaeobacter sp.]
MARSSQLRRAFTLIELLVVVAIIAILISIAYPVYTGILERGKATKDMSNLRQIGLAAQTYMNDNDGVLLGSATVSWMAQLHPKYLPSWNVFQSPFDKRASLEDDANSPISFGINGTPGVVGIAADKISRPSVFILFAPAQKSGTTVSFDTTAKANSAAPGVTVRGIGGNRATSSPGGNATGGTHNNRNRINALFADLHSETMLWTTFTNNAATANDPGGYLRWNPF